MPAAARHIPNTDDLALADAALLTLATWRNEQLLPIGGEDLPSELQRLAESLAGHGYATLRDVRADPTAALQQLTGLPLTPYKPTQKDTRSLREALHPLTVTDCHPGSEDMHRLHRQRNLLAALLASPELAAGGNLDALLATMPILAARRTMHTFRPLTADEVLLCRLVATAAARRPRSLQGAATFALADGGATPGETTGVRVCDLDRRQAPSGFALLGSTRTIPLPYDPAHSTDELPQRQLRAARTGRLDDWGSRIVTRQLAVLARAAGGELDPAARVSYGGGHQPGGQQATMSAQRVIDGILVKGGLYHLADITAKSVSLYAAQVAADRGDRQAALALTGETEHRTRRLLTTDLPKSAGPRPATPRFRRAA
ncbi:hypothetical protein ACI78R_01380 [Geodermatophilus sp. SYSU D01106]